MSDRAMWKMLHLLYNAATPTISDLDLREAGVTCYPDTIQPLLDAGLVERTPPDDYRLGRGVRDLLRFVALANRRWSGNDMWVDYPEAFVIMPFSEDWSSNVYASIIEPAVRSAGLGCVRGDTFPRVGDLGQNLWNQIMRAGIVIAEVSVPNVNVFYELGITHAIGKDAVLLKQKDAELPADFGGAHYYEYDLADADSARKMIGQELRQWAADNCSARVQQIYGG